MSILEIVEIIGTCAFALSGAVAAMRKRLDIFGVLIITFITAIGGGTIRDILIGSTPVAWMLDLEIIITISATYIVTLFFHRRLVRLKHTIFWADTVGLAVFCMVAIDKAIGYDLHVVVCIALGMVTGIFGGVLRDVLLNEIPYVFRRDIYASACIAGGVVFFTLRYFGVEHGICTWIGGAVIILVRIGDFYFHWRLPLIYDKKGHIPYDEG